MVETLCLEGELTFNTVQTNLKRLSDLLVNQAVNRLKLDLTHIKKCDSAGLALLVEAKRLSKKHKKQVEILGASQAIYALAEFCGVEVVLNDN
ncbi:STAS domain-containing protein [Legionella yabuuchiae]|uniref:STAS domain-containing protein n=1 Tax=Legionella yabuuchiae TaxID=376727 RepID=UPI0010555480|nr:STAS domain-containing protein [Legionella yabuuchiae]